MAAGLRDALRRHWPEYLIEALGLGGFMLSACLVVTLIEHPASPVRQAIAEPWLRRALTGVAMGLTAVAIIYSPWGKRSGAHINPSVTLAFYRLGKVAPRDGAFYVAAQFVGAGLGVAASAAVLGLVSASRPLADPAVNYVVTAPGPGGVAIAFAAELVISCVLMLVVLETAASARLARYTGLFAGCLVALYIAIEAPLSGMSMNPARTFGSAVVAQSWTALWLYFTAPPLGMLLATELYLRLRGPASAPCAKLRHPADRPCIFCGQAGQRRTGTAATKASF
jgi:aquaporin Z